MDNDRKYLSSCVDEVERAAFMVDKLWNGLLGNYVCRYENNKYYVEVVGKVRDAYFSLYDLAKALAMLDVKEKL